LHYREAYEKTAVELFQLLSNVTTKWAAQSFTEEAVSRVKAVAAVTDEFYIGEFYSWFRQEANEESKRQSTKLTEELAEIRSTTEEALADVNERLFEARTAGDRGAEHALWGEAERKQTEPQAAVERIRRQLRADLWQIYAVLDMAPGLGFPQPPLPNIELLLQLETPSNDDTQRRNS
jgi:hypothetical protein